MLPVTYYHNKNKYSYRKVDTVKVKGKNKAVGVIEILNGNSKRIIDLKLETRPDFEKGIELYKDQKFYEAIGQFRQVLEKDPKDKAAENYLQRASGIDDGSLKEEKLAEKKVKQHRTVGSIVKVPLNEGYHPDLLRTL